MPSDGNIPADDGLDDADKSLLDFMTAIIRRDVVAGLLRGNDAGCFSTAQYVEAYQKSVWKSEVIPLQEALAVKHLRGLPHLVEEVRPGVWRAKGD